MNGKRMCQSYEIIDSRRVGDTEVVLGYSPTEVSPYVTWKCYAYDNFQGYNYGRYFGDEQAARKNMKQSVSRDSSSGGSLWRSWMQNFFTRASERSHTAGTKSRSY